MDFQSVYESLLDVFPQIDSRLLRAVAIEHHKDADAAVEIVLSEILPQLANLSKFVAQSSFNPKFQNGVASVSIPKDKSPLVDLTYADENPSEALTSTENNKWPTSSSPEKYGLGELVIGGDEEQINLVRPKKWVAMSNGASSSGLKQAGDDDQTYYVNFPDDEKLDTSSIGRVENEDLRSTEVTYDSSFIDSKTLSASQVSSFCEVIDGIGGNIESEEVIVLEKAKGKDSASQVSSFCEVIDGIGGNIESEEVIVLEKAKGKGKDLAGSNQSHAEFFSLNETQDDMVRVDQEQNSHVMQNISVLENYDADNCGDNNLLDEKNDLDMNISAESPKSLSIPVAASVQEQTTSELNLSIHGDENEPMLNTTVTRSGQICDVDLLEEIIEDSKSNKKNLLLAMESIMNKIKEVELQEKAAEKAKEEADEAGLDTIKRVEELKQMLSHAMEANDMHAGEVYGEKSILATEVRELLTRVLGLSEERDISMCILSEMHETLDARFAEATKVMQAFEKEKLEKEESAQSLLAEQEAIMEKVVQGSKILQQEAEENSKLRDFLIERGRVVDALQGEISVVCEDVRLLKEKFENRVPLSKFLSSNKPSSVLASSNSSVKSIASDLKKSVSSKEGSPAPSLYGHSPLSSKAPSLVGDSPLSSKAPSLVGHSPLSSKAPSLVGDSLENRLFEEEKSKGIHKALSDDGWELFEDGCY